MLIKVKEKILFSSTILGLVVITTMAFAALVTITGPLTTLDHTTGNLAETPFSIPGVPTSSNGLDIAAQICVQGDFSFNTENPDFTAEDGITVVGQVNFGGADCIEVRCTDFTISSSNYDIWAADGVLDFTIAANSEVNDFCSTSIDPTFAATVQGFIDVDQEPTAVPTLSIWSLALLVSLMGLFSFSRRKYK